MTAVKGLVFDKDGTLFDFSRSWSGWAAGFLARIATSPDHAYALAQAIKFDIQSSTFDPDSMVIAGTPLEIAEALTPHLPEMSVSDIVTLINREAAQAPQIEAVELSPLLLRFLSLGLTLGVVTNDAEQPAKAHLQAAGVLDLFDFVAGCDSGFGAKPQPGQLHAFLDHSGLSAEDCVMVGDSTHDLIAGRQAGMRCVGVLTGMAERNTLDPLADVVLPDIGHLPEWLFAAAEG